MEAPASFTFAKEVVTQLITLSTALIGVSITFTKDLNAAGAQSFDRRWLRRSWIILLVSVAFGIWTLMALTGSLATDAPAVDAIFKTNVTIPSILQILSFVIGIALLIRHASR